MSDRKRSSDMIIDFVISRATSLTRIFSKARIPLPVPLGFYFLESGGKIGITMTTNTYEQINRYLIQVRL